MLILLSVDPRPKGEARWQLVVVFSLYFFYFFLLFPLITHITDDFIRVWCTGTAEVKTNNRKLGRHKST